MTRRYRKLDTSYEPQCDADDCEAIAVMTDGQMNWCAAHIPPHMGRPALPEEDRRVSIRPLLEPRYIEQIDRLARQRGLTRSAMTRELIIKALE